MVGILRDVLIYMLAAAMSVNLADKDARNMNEPILEILRCIYEVVVGGSNSQSLIKMQGMWASFQTILCICECL